MVRGADGALIEDARPPATPVETTDARRDTLPPAPPRTRILGVDVHMASLPDAVTLAEALIRAKARGYICHVDARSILAARDDARVGLAFARAALVGADGMPLVWLGRRRGLSGDRLYGPDFMQALIARTAGWRDRPCRHFLFGSTPEVLEALAGRLTQRYPDMVLAGTLAPPVGTWDEETDAALCATIDAAGPDVVWVALGAPRQELWMDRNRHRLAAPLLVGVGAAFDFLAGNKPQAPRWVRRSGFEWLFRAVTEPQRLGPRYARTVPRFAALALAEEIGRLFRPS